MKPRAIHQFHSGSAVGDAVTNGMFLTRRLLRELGFESEIYVERVAKPLADELHSFANYADDSDQVLLVHHSHGHDHADWLQRLRADKILVYHNITPPRYFAPGSEERKYSEIGREQLALFRSRMTASFCDSAFNANELAELGYQNVTVLPLLVDVETLAQAPWNGALADAQAGIFTVLYVGRLVENKCQHHVIEVFRHLRPMLSGPAQLVLVGRPEPGEYQSRLQEQVRAYGLEDSVRFASHVANDDLYAWYRAADCFVSMSEHEGFGVPLIEAMAFDVPVLAYRSSNVPHTLGGAGIQLTNKRFPEIAALISVLARDRALRRTILRAQRRRLEAFTGPRLVQQLAEALTRLDIEIPRPPAVVSATSPRVSYQVEGAFETNYSLAIVNRELAFALDETSPGQVAVFATEGPGDYAVDVNALRRFPGLETLWQRGRKGAQADVVIRNLYPPRVADMAGLTNLLYFAWEESNLSPEWVRSFNRHLDGLTVLSHYVKKVLIDAGVHVPIDVAGCGVEQVLRQERRAYRGPLGKAFRFLHVSSCFPRKGVDILLAAYAQAFNATDDVSLVIKTYPNIHNTVEEQVRELRAQRPDCPDIVLIKDDLPAGCMVDLYQRCHAFVAPTRGEGFGLPMAEAMLFELPVITTAYGGQSDFCTPETCWTIDFRWMPAQTHMGLFSSVWVEPDREHLVRLLREVYDAPRKELQPKLRRAKALIQGQFSWRHCARRVQEVVRRIETQKTSSGEPLKLGWVTTWNSKCGIANYSDYLIRSLPRDQYDVRILASNKDELMRDDDERVVRCWEHSGVANLDPLLDTIARERLGALVVQFNFGFFEIHTFCRFLETLRQRGVPTIIIFHATQDVARPDFEASLSQIRASLAGVERLLVHGLSDLNRLKDLGLVRNSTLLPHGVLRGPARVADELRKKLGVDGTPVLASYGFLLPHKGIEQLIEAFALIRDGHPEARLLLVNALYPNPISDTVRAGCMERIARLRLERSVTMINDFLEDAEALCLLQCANLLVFPYQQTGESSSAAVRMGLSADRPVACTPLGIFDNVKEVVHFLPGTSPVEIAQGVSNLLSQPELLHAQDEIRSRWLDCHSWQVMGQRLDGMIRALVRESKLAGSLPWSQAG